MCEPVAWGNPTNLQILMAGVGVGTGIIPSQQGQGLYLNADYDFQYQEFNTTKFHHLMQGHKTHRRVPKTISLKS